MVSPPQLYTISFEGNKDGDMIQFASDIPRCSRLALDSGYTMGSAGPEEIYITCAEGYNESPPNFKSIIIYRVTGIIHMSTTNPSSFKTGICGKVKKKF